MILIPRAPRKVFIASVNTGLPHRHCPTADSLSQTKAFTAWELHKAWPGSRFVLVDDEGHGGPTMSQAVMAAIAEHTETD